MHEQQPQADTPIEIRGYVTDPKQVGYQILNNYENLYWATLVGPVAWRLYELLRGFCHGEENIVESTVTFLTAAVSPGDRRALTGRIKRAKGKEYYYPGLIEILQREQLIIAEEVGSGPTMKYLFHVNKTPGLLSKEQVSVLPEIIQQNHENFLARHKEKIRLLEAKKRQSKVVALQEAISEIKTEGEGNSQGSVGNSHTPSGKFPDKQEHTNNTENSSSSGAAASLERFGIDKQASQRLIERYSPQRIAEKIEHLEFMLETTPSEVKNPGGWLRRAIENDYKAPPGFQPKSVREAEAAEKERRRQIQEQSVAIPTRSWREWLSEHLQLSEHLLQRTDELVERLRESVPPDDFQDLIEDQVVVVEETQEGVTLAVSTKKVQEGVMGTLHPQIEEAVKEIVGNKVEIRSYLFVKPFDAL